MAGRPGNLALLAAAVVCALLLVEVGLRAAGFGNAWLYTRDPQRGGALRPGARGWWIKEGRDYVRINSRGLRDREHTLAKPAGTLRVAVLGDSYTEALQLPMEQAYWAVLERELGGCAALAGRHVEVLNFGVSGYGTAQELLTLRHVGWGYDPDVVLLAFLTGNDVRNNSRELEGDPDRPYFVERDGQLVLDDRFRERLPSPAGMRLRALAGRVVDNLRLLQLVKLVVDVARLPAVPAASVAPAGGGGGEAPGLDDAVYSPPRSEAWARAWRVTEGLIGLLVSEVRARGARLLVAVLSNPVQVYPDPRAREEFMRTRGIEDLFYPDRRVAAAGARLGVPTLLLAPSLLEHAERTGEFLHGFGGQLGTGHWNAGGHRRVGGMIAAELCRLLGEPAATGVAGPPGTPPTGAEGVRPADRAGPGR